MKLLRTGGSLIIELEGTTKEIVEHCVKSKISLRYADLRDADLQGANLRDAKIQGADLQGADLQGANLRDANLRYAYLRYANLQDANLQDADLRGADLRDADLQGADLQGAYLRYAKNIIIFNKLGGRTCYAIVGGKLMVKAGCFWGTLEEFETACKDKYPNDTIQAYEAQITYLKILQSQIK